jgi:radical SAM superfamily enzyme YgiQ (UPF0313 family)
MEVTMNAVLVGPEIEENLSLRYLAASLVRAGHDCAIVPFNRRRDLRAAAKAVLRRRPSLLGLSLVVQRRYPEYRELATLLRRLGFSGHITAGGHFAGLRAEEILRDAPAIDTVIHHEGEERIVSLMKLLDSGGAAPGALDGISWRAADGSIGYRAPARVAGIDDLAPPLRRGPRRILGLGSAPIVSSRGCAGSCSFCSIHAWHRQVSGDRLRFRSPTAVAREMIDLGRDLGVRVFTFHDDDFLHPDRAKTSERCRAILEAAEDGIGEPFAFILKCRPDQIEEGLFDYLKSKGLVRAYVGIETATQLGIRTLNRRVAPGDNERALAILRSLGILACFNLLVFHPDTTIEELDENVAFLSSNLDHPFDVGRTELYARAALETRMVNKGRAVGDWRGYDYRIADARAEEAFSLFIDALWERHFRTRSMPHRSQDLSFRMNLLRRFHPRFAPAELETRVGALVRDVNDATVEHLRRIAGAARTGSRELAPAGRAALVEAISSHAAARLRAQSIQWASLELEIECRSRIARMVPAAAPSIGTAARALSRAAAAVPIVALAFCGCADKDQVVDPLPPPVVRFGAEIEPYLNYTCTRAGCHSTQDAQAGLVLESGESYDMLVNVPSTQLPAMNRVTPDSSAASYIVHKLEGTQLSVGGSGEQMPKGGVMSPSFIAKLIQWIKNGAPRN